MWRMALGGFAVAHALAHAPFLAPAPTQRPGAPEWPFELRRSRVLDRLGVPPGAVHGIGSVLVVALLGGFAVAGVALILELAWWRIAAVVSALISLVQLGLFFHRWLVLGLVIDVAVIAALMWVGWPPAALIGS